MDKNKVKNIEFQNKMFQEHLCLESKYLINLLITKLFEIESIPSSDFHKYKKLLSELRSDIDKIYWDL